LIAIDTSAMSRALDGILDATTAAVRNAVATSEAYFPPIVLAELLSNPQMTAEARRYIDKVPLLPIHPGYWERAGLLRAEVKSPTRKAQLADTLIAQSCIDHDIPLITYDRDFRHFTDAGLILV
jgi:predicted nucleic acid-binding protein